jgi:NADPH2:quinone reductase
MTSGGHLPTKEYSGSLVNVMTAHAFLEQALAEGHAGVIATAGSSATGLALAALARRRGMPSMLLVRTPAARAELHRRGIEHVIVNQEGSVNHEGFPGEFADLAVRLGATAVFDGVGGALITGIAAALPMNSTIYCYGFLAGEVPLSLPSMLLMRKNLTLKRFSNFESSTVRDPEKLDAALLGLHSCIDDPLFKTRVGEEFKFEQFHAAMSYEAVPGAKAVFIP